MKLFTNFRKAQEVKQAAIDKIDEEILNSKDDDRVNPDRVIELMEARRKLTRTNIGGDDILKVVANVAIVAVMVGFEMSHIMNQKGTRFIKPL